MNPRDVVNGYLLTLVTSLSVILFARQIVVLILPLIGGAL